MFLETSRPINPGWKARLVSKYVGMRVACLKFWYHAFGRDIHMGELQLVIKTDSGVRTVSLNKEKICVPISGTGILGNIAVMPVSLSKIHLP